MNNLPPWETVPLGEMLRSDRDITYGIVQPGASTRDGIPVIRVKDIRDGRIDITEVLRVSSEIESQYERSRLHGGEVLLTLVGSVGESAVVESSLDGWNIARAVALIRVREDVGGAWVSYALRSPDLKQRMDSRVTTTVQATLNLRDVRLLPIPLPPPNTRQAIVNLLGALEDKIASNTKIASCARDLMQTAVAGAARDDWPRVSVASLARFVNGGAFTKGASGTGRMVIRIAELNGGPGPSTVYNDIAVPADQLARSGDLLMSWSGSLGVYVWSRPEAIINQHIFKVMTSSYPRWLVHLKLGEVIPEFRQIAQDKATTMGHIKRHHLDDLLVQVPPKGEVDEFDRAFQPLWDRMVVAEMEALTLQSLRDVLLPELLSGRLRFSGRDGPGPAS